MKCLKNFHYNLRRPSNKAPFSPCFPLHQSLNSLSIISPWRWATQNKAGFLKGSGTKVQKQRSGNELERWLALSLPCRPGTGGCSSLAATAPLCTPECMWPGARRAPAISGLSPAAMQTCGPLAGPCALRATVETWRLWSYIHTKGWGHSIL